MFYISMYMMFIWILSILILKISMILSKKKKNELEKMSPFECGFDPLNFSRMPFSIHFFLISIIFLIFDVEIALILPIIYLSKISIPISWIFSILLILLILLMGIIHEWIYKTLNW